jgi:hypothetical protein
MLRGVASTVAAASSKGWIPAAEAETVSAALHSMEPGVVCRVVCADEDTDAALLPAGVPTRAELALVYSRMQNDLQKLGFQVNSSEISPTTIPR